MSIGDAASRINTSAAQSFVQASAQKLKTAAVWVGRQVLELHQNSPMGRIINTVATSCFEKKTDLTTSALSNKITTNINVKQKLSDVVNTIFKFFKSAPKPEVGSRHKIVHEHTYKGKSFGTETVTRFGAADSLKAQYLARGDSKRLENLEKDNHIIKGAGGCFGSNYHRDFCKAKAKELGDSITADQLKEIADETSPGLINAREVTLIRPDGKEISLMRVGVMSDLRNGTVSLDELQKIVAGDKSIEDKVHSRIDKLEKKHPKGAVAKASIELSRKALENPEKALIDRQERMETIMLEFLSSQISGKNLQDGETLKIVDLRLLNPKKSEMFTDSGWVHNEEVELRDMHTIFKQFDGQEVILDGKGPYIDNEGKAHLPFGDPNQPKTVKLSLQLMNVSVQGYTKNDGIQAEYNEQTIATLEEQNPQLLQLSDWKEAKEMLQKGESNPKVAERVLSALINAGLSVSCGCLSAKDRTGWVVGRSLIKSMTENLNEQEKITADKHLTAALLDKDSVVMQVVNDVTDSQSVPKINPLEIRGEVTGADLLKHTFGLIGDHIRSKTT